MGRCLRTRRRSGHRRRRGARSSAEDITAAGAGLIDLLLAAGGELVTVLIGAGVDPGVGSALHEHVHRRHLGAELVTYHTGHRGDALLIGVE